MTIYWERCSICGRYHAVKQCTMHPDLMVCPHCCLACPLRDKCPEPAWYPSAKKPMKTTAMPPVPSEAKAEKVLKELLSKLEEG